MVDNSLKDKIVWITGGGRGIGQAAAEAFAKMGSKVVVSARTEEQVMQTVREIQNSGGTARAGVCDVTKADQVQNTVNMIKDNWGTVDILVNNAGIGIFKKILNTTLDDWQTMLDVNLTSAFLCTQAVLPDMIENKNGMILNIVSVAGKQPYYNCGGYCASKYGMLGFTDVLRMETRKHGIKVVAVLPGATDTDIWGDANVDRTLMMTPQQVANSIVSACTTAPDAMVEEIVLRPVGGDL